MFGIQQKSPQADPRVTNALDELGVEYEVDEDGDIVVGTQTSDVRKQVAFIRSSTYEFAGVELREIFSVGLKSFGPFDARTTNLLLAQNAKVNIGAWAVIRNDDDDHLALFTTRVAADLRGEALRAAIGATLHTADEIEQRLSGRDDF